MSRTAAAVRGSMRVDGGSGVVRVESRYATSPEDLWEALVDPARLARWLGEVSGDLRVGGAFDATFASGWSGPGRVELCEPPRRLRVRTGEADEETEVEAWLTPDGDGVLLVVEERGLPLDQLPAYGAGWQVHLEDLGHHVDGTARVDFVERWKDVVPGYRSPVDAPHGTGSDGPASP